MSGVRHVRCPTDISNVRIENFDVRRVWESPWVYPPLGTPPGTLFGFPEIPFYGIFGRSLLNPPPLGPLFAPP